MTCPCCNNELTPEVVDRVRASIAALEADPPEPGSADRAQLVAMRALVLLYEEHTRGG